MNLSTLSTTALLTRMRNLETAAHYRATRHLSTEDLERDWQAVRQELNTRPLEEVLAG